MIVNDSNKADRHNMKLTQVERAQELGVTDRSLRNYMKREGWPAEGLIKDQVIWIINNGGDASYCELHDDTEEMTELRKEKLRAETAHKWGMTAKGKEKIIDECMEQIREEAMQFLGCLVDAVNDMRLPEKEGEALKRAIQDSFDNIKEPDNGS